MSELERALRRLDGAVARLEATVGERGMPAPELAELGAERDRLAEEVRRLHARTAEDARLRDEAARAVRSALHDLRGAVGQGNGQGDGHSSAQGDG